MPHTFLALLSGKKSCQTRLHSLLYFFLQILWVSLPDLDRKELPIQIAFLSLFQNTAGGNAVLPQGLSVELQHSCAQTAPISLHSGPAEKKREKKRHTHKKIGFRAFFYNSTPSSGVLYDNLSGQQIPLRSSKFRRCLRTHVF